MPEAVLQLALNGIVQQIVSPPILSEYEEVLRRPRLGLSPERINIVLAQITQASVSVDPDFKLQGARADMGSFSQNPAAVISRKAAGNGCQDR